MRKLIAVTQEDIDHGVRGNCIKCPVSRAIDRQTGKWSYIEPGRITLADPVRVSNLSREVIQPVKKFDPKDKSSVPLVAGPILEAGIGIDAPRSVNRFVRKFDNSLVGRECVKPFRFYLEVP